ncbi:MAG: hypothetical protein AB7U98_02700 [Candidatus Nitrosocosmicus sp.]|jgi:hypothetical protein
MPQHSPIIVETTLESHSHGLTDVNKDGSITIDVTHTMQEQVQVPIMLVIKLDGTKVFANPHPITVRNTKENQVVGNLVAKTDGTIMIIVKVTIQKQDSMPKDTRLVGQKATASNNKTS